MRSKEINEDNWLTNRVIKGIQRTGAKYLPKDLGGSAIQGKLNVRDWADDLYNSWKEAKGAGQEQTVGNIKKWLESSEYEIPMKAVNTALKNTQIVNLTFGRNPR